MRLAGALVVALLCAALPRGAQAADPARVRLVDQRGAAFTLRDLRGEPAIVTFVATRCLDACPVSDAVFAKLSQRRLRAHLVTITLDPEYDTPFVMAKFARTLNAEAPRWRMASGSAADVDALLHAFGVTHVHERAGAHEAPDVHSTFAYIIDARGRLAKTLPLSTNTESDVLAWLHAAS